MPVERIDSIFDKAALQAEFEFVLEGLKKSSDAILKLNDHRVTVKSSDLSSFTKASQDLNKAINQSDTATKSAAQSYNQLSSSVKAHEQNLKTLAQAQIKSNALSSESAIEIAKVNLQNQAQAKANKEVAASVLGLVDDYGLLKKQYDQAANAAKNLSAIALRTGSGDDNKAATDATAKAKALHDSLLQIEQGVGQSQRNVGNYTGALKVLETALTQAKIKLDSMSVSERENTTAGQSLTKEISLLSTLAGQQAAGFVSLRRELQNSTQALLALETQGLAGTAAFKELQVVVADNKRSLNEFNEQQKLLASEVPAIASLTAVARGLGAAYAIGAGASALFAGGNEKVEKELNKLVAVMTLLQGLTELNKTLTESSAIATGLRGIKEGFLNGVLAIRNFILTGNTKAEVEGIAVKEADSLATGELAVTTTVASVALTVFRAALIATGIGAVVVLLVAAVSAMSSFGGETKNAVSDVDALTAALDRQKEALDNVIDDIDIQTETLVAKLKIAGASQGEIDKVVINGLKEKARVSAEETQKQFNDLEKLQNKQEEIERNRTRFSKTQTNNKLEDNQKLIDKQSESYKKSLEDATKAQLAVEKGVLEIQVKGAEEKRKQRDKSVKDESRILRESMKKDLDIISANAKYELEISRDLYKNLYEDQLKSFEERSAALKNFYLASSKLIALDAKGKEDANKLDEKIDLEKASEIKNADLRAKTINQIHKTFEDREIQIKSEGQQAQITLDQNIAKTAIQINKDEFDKEEKALVEHVAKLKQISENKTATQINNVDISTNTQDFAAINESEIDIQKAHGERRARLEKDLQDRIAEIDANGAIERLQIQENELQAELSLLLLSGVRDEKAITDVQAKITDNLLSQTKIRKGIKDQEHQEDEQRRNQDLDKVLSYELALLDLEQAIGDASFIKKKNKLAEEQTAADEKEKRDIEAVNVSSRTEQQKADAISIIQARSEQEKKARDARQRRLDYEKAKFDKEIAILTVVAQIAIDIAKQSYGAAALAGIALIKLIATPIPKYKGGRGEGKEELAYVHEGEFIHREDGRIEKTPAVETLTHLMPKDRVYKNKQTMMKELALSALPLTEHSAKNGNIEVAIEKMSDRIENAVGEIKITTQLITKEGWRTHNEKLANYDSWVNKYIKN